MALSEFKLVVNENETVKKEEDFCVNDYSVALEALGCDLRNYLNRTKEYEFNGRKVLIRGIPEDFIVYLDGKKVCNVVYGQIYNKNLKLFKELVL